MKNTQAQDGMEQGSRPKKPVYKKWWFWVIIIVVVFLVIGITGDEEESTGTYTTEETADASESDDSDSAAADTQADEDISESAASEAEDSAEDDAQADDDTEEITFESLTILDNDEVSAVITGIESSALWGTFALELDLENKSADAAYTYCVTFASVNGLMSDPYFAAEVAAGKKAVEEISFAADTLAEYGIDRITDIEIDFTVYDSDTWETLADETVHVYPYGEEMASVFERTSQDTDLVVIDDDSTTLTIIGYEMDDIWGYTLLAYVENHSDSAVMFNVEDASVNGYMCDPYWAQAVSAGKSAFISIYWGESSLEEIGITDPEAEIENIEFSFQSFDYDTYETYTDETVTLEPAQSRS